MLPHMNTTFRLQVTERRNGTYDHVVTDASGNVIGARNSRRHYKAAAVTRSNRAVCLRYAKASVVENEKQLVEYAAVVATGRVPAGYSLLKVADYAEFLVHGTEDRSVLAAKVAKIEAMVARDEQYPAVVFGFSGSVTGAAKLCRFDSIELLAIAVE